MNESDNKAAARAYFEQLLNRGNLCAATTILADDVAFNYPLGAIQGRDAVKEYVEAVRTAFPDIRFEIHDLFGELNRVGCRWTLTGTRTGQFKGNPPTGRQVEVPGNTVFDLRDGKIQTLWIAFNPALLV
jgi:steroid delta-isomerase-like uncharacterized protein